MSVVRVSLVIWLIVAGAVALGLYQVKYEVQRLEEELQQVRKDIRQDRVALHVLEAEWAYLNRPERLQRLAAKHLDMGPSGAKQVAAVTALPPRISEGEQAMRYASAGGADGAEEALPLPQAKPWSLEQPMYARTDRRQLQPDGRQGEGMQAPLRQASAQVAKRGPERDADGARRENAGTHNSTRSTNNNTAGQVGQSDEPKRLTAKASPPRSSPPESRAIAVGDVLIQVGVRQ
jgi:cell division protein FtsL